jgi:O-antigen ligase
MSASRVIVASFVFIALSTKLFSPPYTGYLIAYGALLIVALASGRFKRLKVKTVGGASLLLVLLVPFTILQTFSHSPDARDVLRDLGAVLALLVGYAVLPALARSNRTDWRIALLRTLSDLTLFIVGSTLVGAALAYRDGASAYFWRGEYILLAHSWLPYLLAVNIALPKFEQGSAGKYVTRAGLCVLGTLVSLSRTDLLMELAFLLFLIPFNLKKLVNSPYRLALTLLVVGSLAALSPFYLNLSVVQERLDVGIDEDDPSISWRLIENAAFISNFESATLPTKLFGAGLGSRVPLPTGIVDFDGRDSIPHLHNSYLTIVLKFGIMGVVLFLYTICRLFALIATRRPSRPVGVGFAGGWILMFSLGDALTLQGFSEWSHLTFVGIAAALIARSGSRTAPLLQTSALVARDSKLKKAL